MATVTAAYEWTGTVTLFTGVVPGGGVTLTAASLYTSIAAPLDTALSFKIHGKDTGSNTGNVTISYKWLSTGSGSASVTESDTVDPTWHLAHVFSPSTDTIGSETMRQTISLPTEGTYLRIQAENSQSGSVSLVVIKSGRDTKAG